MSIGEKPNGNGSVGEKPNGKDNDSGDKRSG